MNASTVRLRMKLRQWFNVSKHLHDFRFRMLILNELSPNMSSIYEAIHQASKQGDFEVYYNFPDCDTTVQALSLRSVVLYEALKRLEQKGYNVDIVRPDNPAHIERKYYRTLKISWK